MKATKRLLALLLCIALVMGLCTTGFAAVSEEEYASVSEKIQWLIDNNYVEGDESGLRADDTITRAEFATILARAISGITGEDYAAYANLANGFNDVAATDWFAGAVNYCFAKDAVAGFGDGTFQPNANVTGVQAAKMILCGILAYDEAAYTNTAKWALNVYADAEAAGLFEDVEGDYGEDATRGDCFTMLYNALFVKGVVIDHDDCAGLGLAYVKDYDVAAELYCIKGDGSDDAPFEYAIADGIYTADSFKAICDKAAISLWEYTTATTTTKGVLEEVYSVTLGDEDGEMYFFVKVECDAGTTWYKFVPAEAYAYGEFEGIVIANEYADLYADEPLKAGRTTISTKKGDITVAATTTLDDLGMTFKFETLDCTEGIYNVKSIEAAGTDVVTIITDAEAYEDAFDKGPTGLDLDDAEYFVNFETTATEMVEVKTAFTVKYKVQPEEGEATEKTETYATGEYVALDTVKAWFNFDEAPENPKAGDLIAVSELNEKGDKYGSFDRWAEKYLYIDSTETVYAQDAFKADGFKAGYVYKFINNVEKAEDEAYDFAFVLQSSLTEKVETEGPDAPDAIGEATSFCDVAFGGDDGKSVSVVLTIDGVTYITESATEVVTNEKATYFDSEIPTGKMADAGYRVNSGNKNFMDGMETYVVYADLLGQSAAAKPAGLGSYALVTQMYRTLGNLKGYDYSAALVVGETEEAFYDVIFPTTVDMNWVFNAKTNNFVNGYDLKNLDNQDEDAFAWTTLASYLTGSEEDGYDYSLMAVEADLYSFKNLQDADENDIVNDIVMAGGNNVNSIAAGDRTITVEGNTPLYLTENTEIYYVVGDDNNTLLLSCKYSVGYKTLPNVPQDNIHYVYGIFENVTDATTGAYKYTQADVLVIEVYKDADMDGAFVFETAAGKFATLEGITVDAASNTNDQQENYTAPYFYGVCDGVVIREDDGKLVERWADRIVDIDTISTTGEIALTEDDYIPATTPIYAIVANGDYYKAVTLGNEKKGDDPVYEEGDVVIVVEKDLGTNYNTNKNGAYTENNVAYLIDLTKSCDDVQQMFNYGVYLQGKIGEKTVVEKFWVRGEVAGDAFEAKVNGVETDTKAAIVATEQFVRGAWTDSDPAQVITASATNNTTLATYTYTVTTEARVYTLTVVDVDNFGLEGKMTIKGSSANSVLTRTDPGYVDDYHANLLADKAALKFQPKPDTNDEPRTSRTYNGIGLLVEIDAVKTEANNEDYGYQFGEKTDKVNGIIIDNAKIVVKAGAQVLTTISGQDLKDLFTEGTTGNAGELYISLEGVKTPADVTVEISGLALDAVAGESPASAT